MRRCGWCSCPRRRTSRTARVPSGSVRRASLPSTVHSRRVVGAERVGERDRAAEGVAFVAGDGAQRVGDLGGQARRRRSARGWSSPSASVTAVRWPRVVVGVAGGAARRVGHRGAVAALVVLWRQTRAVRAGDRRRAGRGRCTRARGSRPSGRVTAVRPARLVVGEGGGAAEGSVRDSRPVVAVVVVAGVCAERVGLGDDLERSLIRYRLVWPAAVVTRRDALAGALGRVVLGEAELRCGPSAALGDAAVLVVVDVVVAAAVGVGPGGDAAGRRRSRSAAAGRRSW